MFERYTERARRIIFFARYEASALRSPEIGTEHLLLGLLREGPAGIARQILQRGPITHELVTKEVERRIASRAPAPVPTSLDIPLSPAARRVLQYANEEAERMDPPCVDAPRLLVGLLREPGSVAADILASGGLRLEEVREEVRLQSAGKDVAPRPREAFPKVVDFLRELEQRGSSYHVTPFREEALRVEVALPEERWVATFFADGRVTVEVFRPSGPLEDESALGRLLERLGPPRPGAS